MPPSPLSSTPLFILAFATLLGAPLVGALLAWGLRRVPALVRRALLLALALPTGAMGLGLATGWVWRDLPVQALWLAGAWLGYAVLALSSFALQPRRWGLGLGALLTMPLVGGAVMGSVGALVTVLYVGNAVPVRDERLADGRHCVVTPYGDAGSVDRGWAISWREPLAAWPALERVERRVWLTVEADGKPLQQPPANACRMAPTTPTPTAAQAAPPTPGH